MYFLCILGEIFITVSSISIIAVFLGFQLHSTWLSLRKIKLQSCVFVRSKCSVPLRRAAEVNRSNEELSGHRYPREGQEQEGSTVGSGIKPISPRSYLRLQQGKHLCKWSPKQSKTHSKEISPELLWLVLHLKPAPLLSVLVLPDPEAVQKDGRFSGMTLWKPPAHWKLV